MHTLYLTSGELEFLRARMQLTAMNESGADADRASSIVIQIDDALAERTQQHARAFVDQFADLFPAGGRE